MRSAASTWPRHGHGKATGSYQLGFLGFLGFAVETVLGAHSEEIVGEKGNVAGLKLKDGRVLPCDLLVMAIGIRPNATLARDAGLAVNRGDVSARGYADTVATFGGASRASRRAG